MLNYEKLSYTLSPEINVHVQTRF